MGTLFDAFAQQPGLFLTIPVTAAVLGWATNALCLRMLTHPLEFMGLPPRLGWQGILPRHAPELAGEMADQLSRDLLPVEELYARLDIDLLVHALEKPLYKELDAILEQVMHTRQPALWTVLPGTVKRRILRQLAREIPGEVRNLLESVRADLDTALDIRTLVAAQIEPTRALVTRPFLEPARQELRFLCGTGLILGLAAGLLELLAWVLFPVAALLPLSGLLIGAGTNWLAMQWLFRPAETVACGPLQLQSVLHRRHHEITSAYIAAAAELLTPRRILRGFLRGPAGEKLPGWIAAGVDRAFTEHARLLRTYISLRDGREEFAEIRAQVTGQLVDRLPDLARELERPVADAFRFGDLLNERLGDCPDGRLADLLEPVIRRHLPLLVAIGGLIGFALGCIQYSQTFAGMV